MRTRRHPARRERDVDAATERSRIAARVRGRSMRSWSTSVPSRSSASRRIGKRGSGHDVRRAGSGVRRLDPSDPRQAGQIGQDLAGPVRHPLGDERGHGIGLVRPDLEERDAVGREARGRRSTRRPIGSSPSGPPSSANAGLERGGDRQAVDRVGRDVGQVRAR